MKPDFEQDAADLFVALRCGRELVPMGEGIELLETHLRAAYAAGLERAAEIVCEMDQTHFALKEIIPTIRAEREADHG